jgi:hypothetical protein
MSHPKYGKNELDHLELCPRCAGAVPVFLRTISDRFETKVEVHCLKCRYYGHKDGTFINELNNRGKINGR